MENATKALMIAAAVLVAILVISLGIGIFNNASEQANAGNLDEYEVKAFNDKFMKYAGEGIKGSEINALISTAFNHNMAQDEEAYTVEVKYGSTTIISAALASDSTAAPSKLPTGALYDVVITMGTNKLVNTITISDHT